MDIFSFTVHFTDEESCRLHYKAQRDKEGVTCNRCGGTSHYWLKNKWAYQCRSCEARQTLRSGTIGYIGSNCASDFGRLVPGISVQIVPILAIS